MSLTAIPAAERIHIGFFGLRNAGKSSLVNALANQNLSIVSDTPGTTTDTVKKTMELLPIGPVVLLDTAGFDDEGELGQLRVEATRRALLQCDVAVLVRDGSRPITQEEQDFLSACRREGRAHLTVYNKCDQAAPLDDLGIPVSAKTHEGLDALRAALSDMTRQREEKYLVRDLVAPGEVVLLVTPIDESAPKGRIILPQQQTLRELLDRHAIPVFCQPQEVAMTQSKLQAPPRLVITDSQAFSEVAKSVPDEVALTSFSILFARYKGDLAQLVQGAAMLKRLSDSSHVLISEGCTHHRQCGDIGTVKLPQAIRRLCGANPHFSFTQGGDFPTDTRAYDVVVHCGACMLGEAQVKGRMARAKEQNTPMTNYGIALALASGILPRALRPLGIELPT